MSWLIEVAQVAIALIPVIAAVAVIIAAGITFYGQVVAIEYIGNYAANYLHSATALLSDSFRFGNNQTLFLSMMYWVNASQLLSILLSIAAAFITVLGAVFAVVEVTAAGLVAVHVYRKAKLFANMLAARGAIE